MTSEEERERFNFSIFPITWHEVDEEVLSDFATCLKLAVRESGFTCSLTDIMLAVLILDPGVPAVGNSKAVRKSGSGCKLRRHIDMVEWQAASTRQKKVLLEQCVGAALASIPDKYLSGREKADLEAIARRALYPKRKQNGNATVRRDC